MKLDFIISSLGGGGAERVLTLMVNSLAKNPKNSISVITLFQGKEDYKLDPAVNRVKLKQTKFIPSHTFRSIINLSRYYRKKSNRPHVIVSFITLTNLIAIVVAKLFSIKIIAQEHNSFMRHMDGRERITDFTKKHVYKMADVITVLTSYDIEYYQKHGATVYVMPNPCSFTPISENSHNREQTILAVGQLDRYHHKGLDNLIKLIAPILKEYPDWQLKIAGSGKKGLKHLTQLAEEHHILDKVIFTGFINNVSEVMYQTSIFILPSRFEGLPMVLLEAMSQGMACIAYDCKTGPSDIIENDKNGFLIEDQNMTKMQKGLGDLLISKDLRLRLSNEGINSLDKYNISAITERYEALFKKIVKT
ncbi:glycosyltransferase involved in cell wall biosynthesis [Gelidibacter algens]|uniref:Glycosyltransferase involved in cell wall biosynthesis n=1 Tax=Gelidibacter algens TaxID=49280 RepID=A0A1A7QRQ9_9FLAO|nr:glycosyltransferase family 4 protein [Gelidibacter algens]OBX21894.1 group 1 glycosyl transferase [Gelidibacter algens]RAJ27431.1 glycosyltransferase involved in cell wall biosynthesis [Gelidibacter algens]